MSNINFTSLALFVGILSAIVIMFSEGYVASVVRQGPTYWPVLRMQTATNSARAAHILFLVLLHPLFPFITLNIYAWLLNFGFGAVMHSWTAYLVWKRNRLEPGEELDDYGRITHEGEARIRYHVEALDNLIKKGLVGHGDYQDLRQITRNATKPEGAHEWGENLPDDDES